MNLRNHFQLGIVLGAASSAAFCSASFADDAVVRAALQSARESFSQRNAMDLAPTHKALNTLSAAEGKADDSDLNYDVLILEARAYYWNGEHAHSNADKLAIFSAGQAKADEAKDINDAYAEAYYYAGINLARWAETEGVFSAIGRKQELIDYMNNTLSRVTRDGLSGENIDGDGPNRVFGRLYFKLPGILGGSHDRSVEYFRKAVAHNVALNYPFPLNTAYYAETLSTGTSAEKEEAKHILDELLKNDPKTYNSVRAPENIEEFQYARHLRSQL